VSMPFPSLLFLPVKFRLILATRLDAEIKGNREREVSYAKAKISGKAAYYADSWRFS
jgi:hypothetical protein